MMLAPVESLTTSRPYVDFGVIIPARWGSTRLPGKPLRPLLGRPMIVHVLERAWESGATSVTVATDDERIAQVVVDAGGEAVLTSPVHASGSDRIAEVVQRKGLRPDDIVVNVQGDEPLIDPNLVRVVARALAAEPAVSIATIALPIRTARDLFDPNVVKVVTDDRGVALYFSRAPIPYVRDAIEVIQQGGELPLQVSFWRHVGIYAYRVGALLALTEQPPLELERAERLEQLRALALGMRIHVSRVMRPAMPSVDTERDLEAVEEVLRTWPPPADPALELHP